jgi:hypothetical protein
MSVTQTFTLVKAYSWLLSLEIPMYETAPDQTWEFKGIYLFRCDSIQQCEFYLLEVLFGFLN